MKPDRTERRTSDVPPLTRMKLIDATAEYAAAITAVEGTNLSSTRYSKHDGDRPGMQALLFTAPDDVDAVELLDDIQRVIDAYLEHLASWEALQWDFRRATANR